MTESDVEGWRIGTLSRTVWGVFSCGGEEGKLLSVHLDKECAEASGMTVYAMEILYPETLKGLVLRARGQSE